MKRSFILILAAVVLLQGCAWLQREKEEKPAKVLASEGLRDFKKGNYRTAIKSFEKIKDWYPFSKYSILAELKIADSHYALGEYEDAIFAYEEFESLHPRNEAMPYVIYRIGRCYFNRLDTIDRDQSVVHQALDTFYRLKRQYPDSKYSLKSEEHIHRCLKSLAGHELYVGKYYLKSGHYKAALKRFETVITKYPDLGIHKEALTLYSLCKKKVSRL